MEKKSWVCTLLTQLALCFALFLAFQIGRHQKPIFQNQIESRPLDLYFISVRGGSRPLQEQTHLLKQIEKVVKTYKVKFVINISELGEDDPLMQNATGYFRSFKVPWYATKASKVEGADYFLRQVKIPNGSTLDVILVDTSSLQDPSSSSGNDQLNWLKRTLKASNANWRVVAGFHPMLACNHTFDQTEMRIREPLQQIFLKYEVNAYVSGQACSGSSRRGDRADISNPVAKGPYFTAINQRVAFIKEAVHEFLLHRVSALEIVTYFVTSTGEVQKNVIRQLGREVM